MLEVRKTGLAGDELVAEIGQETADAGLAPLPSAKELPKQKKLLREQFVAR